MKDIIQTLEACDKIIEAYYLTNQDVLKPDERDGVRSVHEDVRYHLVRNTVIETVGLAKYLQRACTDATELTDYTVDTVRDLIKNVIRLEDDLYKTFCC